MQTSQRVASTAHLFEALQEFLKVPSVLNVCLNLLSPKIPTDCRHAAVLCLGAELQKLVIRLGG